MLDVAGAEIYAKLYLPYVFSQLLRVRASIRKKVTIFTKDIIE